jgi:hypothetical protein
MNKAAQKKFYSIEESEQEDFKKSWSFPTQYRCFLNCLGRVDKKKYKTVLCSDHSPTAPPGSFPVVTMSNNNESKNSIASGIDDQDLLKAFQKETIFKASNWISDDVQDTLDDDMSDYFSVGPVDIDCESTYSNMDIFLRRHSHYSSLNSEMGYITEDESVNTLENVLLQEVSGWVPFDSVSFSPTRKHNSAQQQSSSPRTPIAKNSQVESHGTPATETTEDSLSNTESILGSAEDVLVSFPTLSDLDYEENDNIHNGHYDDGSIYDYSLANGSEFTEDSLSALYSTNATTVAERTRKKLEKGHIVHSPPNPNRHRQEISRFFQKNEVSQSFDMELLSEGETVPEYVAEFHPDKCTCVDIDSHSNTCLSNGQNGSNPNEKTHRHSFEDIGSRNNVFDALYHSSMSSVE